jgi:uncharacterized protein (TIGR02646 family)
MIKLDKGGEPEYLANNKAQWLRELNEAITQHGGFSQIPSGERDKLIRHYKDREIKSPLCQSSHEKCAFCESKPGETGYPEIDHFKPKSLYPLNGFDWDNLLPVCRKCNVQKGKHDTVTEPIIDPYKDDPELAFEYDGFEIKAKVGSMKTIAQKTIDVCRLNELRLLKQRSEILVSLRSFEQNLETAILNNASVQNLRAALSRIREFENPEQKFAGFCRAFLKNSKSYQSAKNMMAEGAEYGIRRNKNTAGTYC